jgi:signal transduction histidine kinase
MNEEAEHKLAQSVAVEARRMSEVMAKVLDLARLQAGATRLDLGWHAVEEVIGAGLARTEPQLARHHVTTRLPIPAAPWGACRSIAPRRRGRSVAIEMMLKLACRCSSGLTGGGIKMIRTLVLLAQAARESLLLRHPGAVRPMKLGGTLIENKIVFACWALSSSTS